MANDCHISDAELTQAVDAELSPERAAEVADHLSHCWKCRARRSELEEAIAEFVRLRGSTLDSRVPPIDGAAARLRAHLAAAAAPEQAGFSMWRSQWNRFATPITVALTITAGTLAIVGALSSRATARSLPDARLTPGATRLISQEQVCVVPAMDDDRPVPRELAYRVFKQYGIHQPPPRTYEVDYLITPALGGADDIRNLWPQPYESGVWTSRVKDALEDYLRTQVCQGHLDLATAQHEIASDWIAAYRKYFGTARPLPAHALFVKDRPWE